MLIETEVWFVTADSDFLDKDDRLSVELMNELDALSIPRDRLRRFASIEDCVAALIAVAHGAVEALDHTLKTDAGYYNHLADKIATVLSDYELDTYELPRPAYYAEEGWVDTVEEVRDIRLRDVRPVIRRDLFVRMEAICDARVELLIHKSEAAEADADSDSRFKIANWNWNESYVQAYADARLKVEMSGIVTQPEFSFSQLEVDSVSAVGA